MLMAPSSGSAFEQRHKKSWPSSSADGCLKASTRHPCGLTPDMTCFMVPSLPAASMAWRTIRRANASVRPQQLLGGGELVDELLEILLGDLLALLLGTVLIRVTQPVGSHALGAALGEASGPSWLDPHFAQYFLVEFHPVSTFCDLYAGP